MNFNLTGKDMLLRLTPSLKKTLLVMKLTFCLLTIIILHVNALTVYSQVTLNRQNVTLETALDEISKQTDYAIFYNRDDLKNYSVTLHLNNSSLQQALSACLQGLPLTYQIEDKTVFLKKKQFPPVDNVREKPIQSIDQPANITGRVTDSLGQPLIGASVLLKETKYNTLTDNKGNFIFHAVPQGKYKLIVSYVGYAWVVSDIIQQGKELNLTLVARLSTAPLDMVQVIAYGTQSKRFSVGSVTTVTADAIEKQPVTNALLALEGQVAGLNVTASNGVPGSTSLVQIRGQNTLGTNSAGLSPYDQPLFIIDGVPSPMGNISMSQLNTLASNPIPTGGLSQATGISAFNGINTNDIESITILKDADATAIYGSEGANGVVLITTKKGKAGKTTFDLNVNSQFNSVAKPVQLLNTQQYLQLRKDAFTSNGDTPSNDPNSPYYAPDLTIYNQNKYTDWTKLIQGKNTNNTDMHASVSGGGATSTFIVSGGYVRSDYNYPGDFSDQEYTLHSGLHVNSSDRKFTLDLTTNYNYEQNISAAFGGSQDAVIPPNAPDEIDGKGNLLWNYMGVPIQNNFYATLKEPTTLTAYSLNNSLNLNYEIVQGLKIGAGIGYSRLTNSEHAILPSSAQMPSPYTVISATFGTNSGQTLDVEPQINYNKTFGKGVFSALIGGTYKKNTTYSTQDQAGGYTNDNFLNSVNGAASQTVTDAANIIKYVAAFGRINYIYDQKYIFEASGNRDGSSNFGPGRQFGNFWSLGAGWIFSEEKAFKDALPFLSFGKLSGNYGLIGSDAALAYQYQPLYSTGTYLNSFQGTKQSYPVNVYNPDFHWATKKEINLAADIGFFNNRLLINATYYRSRSGDQLLEYPLPIQDGFYYVYQNLSANVQNKGWEFTITSTNLKSKDFNWTTSFNLAFNRNKLISFPNLAQSPYASQYVIGQPTSIMYGFRYKDVNPTTGLFEYYAANGTVTSTPNFGTTAQGGDEVVIGNRETNYMGGIGNNFNYKQFSLYVFCQFSSSYQPNYISALYSGSAYPGEEVNLPTYILGKYWTAPEQNATIQRLSTLAEYSQNSNNIYYYRNSSAGYSNDTYLRIKTVALSYSLPDEWLKKFRIQAGSVYINAQNLFTITNYKVGDPEQPGNYSAFPIQRIIAIGLKFKF